MGHPDARDLFQFKNAVLGLMEVCHYKTGRCNLLYAIQDITLGVHRNGIRAEAERGAKHILGAAVKGAGHLHGHFLMHLRGEDETESVSNECLNGSTFPEELAYVVILGTANYAECFRSRAAEVSPSNEVGRLANLKCATLLSESTELDDRFRALKIYLGMAESDDPALAALAAPYALRDFQRSGATAAMRTEAARMTHSLPRAFLCLPILSLRDMAYCYF